MPDDEQRALWAAIRANPADDAPRLVYADWLQEHGDEPRAEFIRAQIELANQPVDKRRGRKRREQLKARETELMAAHRLQWAGPLRDAIASDQQVERLEFKRGFLARVVLSLPAIERLSASGAEPEPIDDLTIGHYMPDGAHSHAAVAAAAAWPFGALVRTFTLSGVTGADVRVIVSGGRLTNLTRLDLASGTIGDGDVAALAGSPIGSNLKMLYLPYNRITDAGARALIGSPHLPASCELELYGNPIGPAAAAELRERFRFVRTGGLTSS
jgi:uncharacterized protein (TIGR02996 family)